MKGNSIFAFIDCFLKLNYSNNHITSPLKNNMRVKSAENNFLLLNVKKKRFSPRNVFTFFWFDHIAGRTFKKHFHSLSPRNFSPLNKSRETLYDWITVFVVQFVIANCHSMSAAKLIATFSIASNHSLKSDQEILCEFHLLWHYCNFLFSFSLSLFSHLDFVNENFNGHWIESV